MAGNGPSNGAIVGLCQGLRRSYELGIGDSRVAVADRTEIVSLTPSDASEVDACS
jgi:hypothetical protein